MNRILTVAARLTGRIWFRYWDQQAGRERLYFGKADSAFLTGKRR
jgi:hypothetical protein